MSLLLFFLLVFLPVPGWATAYFADPAGSGTTCTAGAPCKDFHTLFERTLSPGDTLNLTCGKTYRETQSSITPGTTSNGTASNRITLQATGPCYERKGVHTGGNNVPTLTDTSATFTAGNAVQPGDRLFNLTKGAQCNVQTVTATSVTCAETLSHTLDTDWDTGDRYVVHNKPIVTHASLFNAGWSCSGGVCSHPTTKNAGRHVWFDGRSTNPQVHDGSTCNATAMGAAGVEDGDYCTTNTTLYVKTGENPATRWTTPGVEVVHLFDNQTKVLAMSNRHDWMVKDIAMEKVNGTPISWGGLSGGVQNVTLLNVRLGQSQRRNCLIDLGADPPDPTKCYGLHTYQWMSGDDRGGELITMGSSVSASANVIIDGLLGHDCENNCISLTGTQSWEGKIRNSELFNNNHSIINSGFSTGARILTIENNTLHHCTTCWHTNATGTTQTVTFKNNLVYDVAVVNDPKHFVYDGRTDPFGIYLQDKGTYTHIGNIVIGGGHGFRVDQGTHVFLKNVIVGNSHSGINASGSATVQLNDNILADNGGSTVNSSSFQVGCNKSPCPDTLFEKSGSNNNKFSPPSGTNIGWMSGQADEVKSLVDWQGVSNGDLGSTTSAECFVSAATQDFNLAVGCNDIGASRGPFRELTFSSAAMVGTSLNAVWSIGGIEPISKCRASLATVTYDGVGQTEGACVGLQSLRNQTTMVIGGPAPAANAMVQLKGEPGMVEDSTCIGGAKGACLNATSRAFGPTTIGSTGGVPATGWSTASERTIPSGTNRLLVAAVCWEKQPVATSPISFAGCTYGGQPMTQIQSATAIDAALGPTNTSNVHGALWLLNEAGIVAATNTTLMCSTPPGEPAQSARPPIVVSGVYENINQTPGSSVMPGAVTNTLLTGTNPPPTTLTTAPLSATSNPGVALQLACSGNQGSFAPGAGWTEQLDICEDTECGTRLHVADRPTMDDTPAGGITFTSEQTFDARLALLALALNGGETLPPDPGGTTVRTQTASRCAFHNAPGWQGPQDTPCTIVPQHHVVLVAEYQVTGADEPVPVGKQLSCCWGNCDMAENFFPVDDVGTNGVRYAASGLFAHGLEIPDRLLTGAACTAHVPGAFITQDSMVPQALDVGQCSTFAYVIEVLGSVDPQTQPTLTCAMALDNNTPFALGARTTINVLPGLAVGQ